MSKKLQNAQGVEFISNADDFSFVQNDSKIYDSKFDTKPTTFLKDAFKRFCKNKSSVVGAIIIGIIILMSIIVPVASPNVGAWYLDISHPSEVFLKPKLFEAGTGFWDGTEQIEGVAAQQNEDGEWVPIGYGKDYPEQSVSNIVHYQDYQGNHLVSFTYNEYEDVYGNGYRMLEDNEFQNLVKSGELKVEFQYDSEGYIVVNEYEVPVSDAHLDVNGEWVIHDDALPEGVTSAKGVFGTKVSKKDTSGNPTHISFKYTPFTLLEEISDTSPIIELYGFYVIDVEFEEIVKDEEGNILYDEWDEVIKQKVRIKTIKPLCYASGYKLLGYEEAPKFIFGTDQLGRDLFKRCFSGMLESLLFALIITSICFIFGLVWGSISGYFGGNIDLIMERFMEILSGVPSVVVITLFRLHLVDGPEDKLWVFALALCVTGWMGTASRTRTQFYRFKGREYILASRTLGASDFRLIFKHILPNAMGTIVTGAALMIPSLIFTEASYAYLGLGLEGGSSFGAILADNQGSLKTDPILILFPSVIISLLMISFNLFGNGLRDALNPSLKGSD